MEQLSIGKLARAAEVSADTVRYYERMGLLQPPARGRSGYRAYGPTDLRRLLIIRRARRIGFSIQEIAQLLALRPQSDSAPARAFLESKLAAIDSQLIELNHWRAAILALRNAELDNSIEALLNTDYPDRAEGSGPQAFPITATDDFHG